MQKADIIALCINKLHLKVESAGYLWQDFTLRLY